MSYAVGVWCVEPFEDSAALPDRDDWTVRGQMWSLEGKGWLLNTGPSNRALAEDIPDEVVGLLPGISHVVNLSLEPIRLSRCNTCAEPPRFGLRRDRPPVAHFSQHR